MYNVERDENMEKQELLKKYIKDEDRLLIAKCFDKSEICKTRNKLESLGFLDLYQRSILEKCMENGNVKYMFYGGFDSSERTILILCPDKLDIELIKDSFFKIVRIILPSDLKGKYTHKNYLGALMKLGIKREKVGDILVREDGADIIVEKTIAEYVKQGLSELTRFSKSKFDLIDIQELQKSENKKEELSIIVPSIRLDAIVSELIRNSRTKANEAILSGRVFINSESILKNSKAVKPGDIITIRGKGKFEFAEISGNTKKDRFILKILKYVWKQKNRHKNGNNLNSNIGGKYYEKENNNGYVNDWDNISDIYIKCIGTKCGTVMNIMKVCQWQ